jgi:hypothetical protein
MLVDTPKNGPTTASAYQDKAELCRRSYVIKIICLDCLF